MQFDIPSGPVGQQDTVMRSRAFIIEEGLAEGVSASVIAQRAGITRRSVQRRLAKMRRAAARKPKVLSPC